jgi:hypothetical protein
MARISTYPIISTPTIDDLLIGTDVNDLNITKNFTIGEIGQLIGQDYVPYVGATGNVNLGSFNITSGGFIVGGGTAGQFLKANGTLDSTVYTPETRTLTINGTTYNLSANRSWDLNTLDSLTTIGTSGAATYIGKVLNIPVYQAQGSYITQLSGEATAVGPGNATVTLSNSAVISKVLTGLNVTGGTVVSTDTILQAFGKVQNQINGLAGGVEYQGVWNAATNNPFLQSSVGTQGYYYVVNVAGNTNLNGITDWNVGDWAIFNGTTWDKVDNTDAVVSVNGYVGAVVLTSSDVGAVPTTRTLTINGVGYNLSADRSWTVGDVRTDQSYTNPSWIASLAWSKITGTPTTLAGYGITDGALNTRTLTINGTTYDLTANRTWNVGTVTSVGTSGPLTGGTITGSGTIGITQAGASSDGYLSSADWNAFNSKQEVISVTAPITFAAGVIGITQSGASSNGYLSSTDWTTFNSKVSGSGTANTLPMWGTASSLINSPLSYAADTFNFQYNSATGGTVNFTNIGLTAYTYSIQMNNFGSPRSTVHSYTDGVVVQSIGGTQVSRVFSNGNTILGAGVVDNGYKLEISGNLYVNSIVNATTDTDRFIVSDGGVIKYRTGSEILSDIGAGTVFSVGLSAPVGFSVSNSPVTSSGTIALSFAAGYSLPTDASQINWDIAYNNRIASLTTTGTSGAATFVSNVLNIPQYQAQGNYITSLTGEATASGPGAASVTLTNSAVTGKVLTGLTVAGSSVVATDSILTAFGKLQGQVNDLIGGLQYQGTWNASTNTPNITSGVGTDGHFYIVSVAGNTTIDGVSGWQVGDWIVFHSPAWQKVDNTESVVSVNGFVGAVTLTTSNITEGTNLYFTDARSRTAISLTTTGNSGASTYNNTTGVFNIPQYTLTGLGGVPTTRSLTINGTNFDLSADRSWTVGDVRTDSSYSNPSWITSLAWSKISGTPTTLSGYGITDAVPSSRTITINGTTQDLSANRTFNVGTLTGVTASSPLFSSGGITPDITIQQASGSQSGFLSSTDWTTFNSKQNALTNPVTGTGSAGQVAYWSSSSAITGESNLFWDATNDRLGIATSSPLHRLQITQALDGSYPTLGVGKGALFIAGDTNLYGLYIGVNTTDGNTYFQAMRNNTATAYNIVLQSAGGNVGIGTTSPNGKLRIQNDNSTIPSLIVRDGGTPTANLIEATSNAYGNSFIVTATGNVGIGTSSPDTYSYGGTRKFLTLTATATNEEPFLQLIANGSGNSLIDFGNSTIRRATIIGFDGSHLGFFTNGSNSGTGVSERMRITSGGNVLIGTTSDNGNRLRVSGSTYVDGQISSVQSSGTVRTSNADAAGMLHIRPNAGQNGYINFTENAVADRWSIGVTSGDGNFYFRTPYPTSTAVVSISTSGVVTAGQFLASSSGNAAVFTSTGTSGYGLVAVGSAGGARDIFLAGQSGFSNGFTVQYTGTVMKYGFQDGSVGIGTTSPVARLDVIVTSSTVTNNIRFGDSSVGYLAAGGSGVFLSSNDGSPRLMFNHSGNVGIGTTSPTYRLQIGNSGGLADSIRIGDYQVSPNTRQYIGYARNDSGLFESSGNGDSPSTVMAGVAGIRIVNTAGIVTPSQADNSVQLLTHTYNSGSKIVLHASFSGNVGIGTTNPTLHSGGNGLVIFGNAGLGTGRAIMELHDASGTGGKAVFQQVTGTTYVGNLDKGSGSGDFHLLVNGISGSATASMILKASGNVLIGTTTDAGYTLNVVGNAQFIKSSTSTAMVVGLSGVTGSIIRFSYNGGFVGSISTDGSNTAYNTSSDYRLKEQVRPIDNPLEKVLKLNPVNFKYKNSKTVQDGFIAHEIQEILPYLVTGEKDGEQMQEVDYSKLTPILIAAIKEQQAQIQELKNKLS